MQFIVVLAVCFAAAIAAPVEMGIQIEGKANAKLGGPLKAALDAGISADFLKQVKDIFHDENTSCAQKKQTIEALIQKQPADEQAKIREFEKKIEGMKAAMEAEMKSEIAKLSSGAQGTANDILAIMTNENNTPAQIKEQVKAKFASAPLEVQNELKAVRENMHKNLAKLAVEAEAEGSAGAETA